MAELTSKPSPDVFGTKVGFNSCKLPSKEDTGNSPLNPLLDLVFVRYQDHVLYNRSVAAMMQPQIREAVGWLVYECDHYVILSWDRDARPPTLTGGDAKASGLVLLTSDILEFQRLKICSHPLQKTSNWSLNRKPPIQENEYAFRPTERKTHGAIETPGKTKKEKKQL
jgi:hypothetical protein